MRIKNSTKIKQALLKILRSDEENRKQEKYWQAKCKIVKDKPKTFEGKCW